MTLKNIVSVHGTTIKTNKLKFSPMASLEVQHEVSDITSVEISHTELWPH